MEDDLLERAAELEREGWTLGAEGNDRAAQERFTRMKALLVERAEAMPGDLLALRHVATADRHLAGVASSLGKHKEALRFATDAYKACKAQCEGDPARPEPERALRLCCIRSADVLRDMGRRKDAVRFAEEGVGLARWLATLPFEDDERVRADLARSLEPLGWALRAMDRFEDALRVQTELVELARGLDLSSDDGWSRHLLARGLSSVGGILAKLGRLDGARAALDEAVGAFERLFADTEVRPHDLHSLGVAHRRAGVVSARLGDLATAARHLASAVRLGREAASSAPDDRSLHWALHAALSELALVRQREGDERAGQILAREATDLEARLRRR